MSIRILVADDHTIVLQGLSRFLREQEGMEVVGQAKAGYEALELARELAPDVLIMDISMPGLNGIEAARLSTRGFGEYRPLEPNGANKTGNAKNRRVEIYIVPAGA